MGHAAPVEELPHRGRCHLHPALARQALGKLHQSEIGAISIRVKINLPAPPKPPRRSIQPRAGHRSRYFDQNRAAARRVDIPPSTAQIHAVGSAHTKSPVKQAVSNQNLTGAGMASSTRFMEIVLNIYY